MSQLPELSLKRLCLSEQGLQKTMDWRNHPYIYKWCRQNETITVESHLEWYDWQLADPNTKMYAVDVDGDLVGVCGLTSIDWVNRRAEFSLYIGTEHQGKGFGKLALTKLCEHGFNVLNLNSIWGEAFDGNPAIKMFEAVGFKKEGVRREFYYRDGRYIDAILFSLTRADFANLHNAKKEQSDRDAKFAKTLADLAWTVFKADGKENSESK